MSDVRSELWWDYFNSLTLRQRAARWWSIHWPPLFALFTLLGMMATVGWVLG